MGACDVVFTNLTSSQGCTLNPPGIDNRETPARAGQLIDITCNSDSEYNSCFFVHTRPYDVNLPSSHDVDLECSASGGDNGQTKQCPDEPRIAITSTRNSCGLRITNPDPDDTGIWKVSRHRNQYESIDNLITTGRIERVHQRQDGHQREAV